MNLFHKSLCLTVMCLHAGLLVPTIPVQQPWVDLTDPAYKPKEIVAWVPVARCYTQPTVKPTITPFVPEKFLIDPKKNTQQEQNRSLTGQEYIQYRRLHPFLIFFRENRDWFQAKREIQKRHLITMYKKSGHKTLQNPEARNMILQALQHDDVVDLSLASSASIIWDQHLLKYVCEKAD